MKYLYYITTDLNDLELILSDDAERLETLARESQVKINTIGYQHKLDAIMALNSDLMYLRREVVENLFNLMEKNGGYYRSHI